MDLPKVLIIGQTFNKKSGGGITQSNLFYGWDKNKIAVACTAHLLRDSENEICSNYYQLGEKEQRWIFPFNFLQRKFYSGVLKFEENSISDNLIAKKPTIRSKIVDNLFFPFIKYCGLFHSFSKITLSPAFCKWLRDFNPDVIYAQAQDRERILFIILVQSYLKKPLIFHMMDDWPSTITDSGLYKKYWYKKIDHDFRMLMDKATILMSISDEMADEYKIRYNKNFITFHNPVNIDFWKQHQKVDYKLGSSPEILYAGRIGLGIDSSLETIAKVIQSINVNLKMSIKFILQTAEKPEWSNRYSCVVHNSFVPYSELPKIFAEADFLILPYDFSRKSIKYIKYSMPTKATEYMASGTPIIVIAPEETAIAKYAKKYELAKVITNNEINNIAEEIRHLIENEELRKRIAQNAAKLVEKNHGSIEVTRRFREIIQIIANDN